LSGLPPYLWGRAWYPTSFNYLSRATTAI
jgi:hypothetical protein